MSKMKSSTKISELLSKINSEGYSKGLEQFLKNNSEYEFRFNKREGNVAFRAIHKNNDRCLVVNSDLGNIPESISQIYNKVYSLETNKEKILVQKFRFEEKNITNIELIKTDIESSSFPNNHFDLIILNGLKLNKKQNKFTRNETIEYLNKIKEIQDPMLDPTKIKLLFFTIFFIDFFTSSTQALIFPLVNLPEDFPCPEYSIARKPSLFFIAYFLSDFGFLPSISEAKP